MTVPDLRQARKGMRDEHAVSEDCRSVPVDGSAVLNVGPILIAEGLAGAVICLRAHLMLAAPDGADVPLGHRLPRLGS
jgi:hypothetical protein